MTRLSINDGERIGRRYLDLRGEFLETSGMWLGQGSIYMDTSTRMHNTFLFHVRRIPDADLLPPLVPGIDGEAEHLFQSLFGTRRPVTTFGVTSQNRFNGALIDACLHSFDNGMHQGHVFPMKELKQRQKAELNWQKLIGDGIVEVPLIEVVG